MRHEKLPVAKADIEPLDEISVLLELPSQQPDHESNHIPTMHKGVFKSLIGLFSAIMVVFAVTFAGHGYASMMIVVSVFYLAIYVGTPLIMLKAHDCDTDNKTGWHQFLRGKLDTNTGVITGQQALIQVCLIPAGLVVAVLGICFTILMVR